jgi:hypothetical protein
MKLTLIKIGLILVMFGCFFYMDKTRTDKPKEYTLYSMGYATTAGMLIGYLSRLFQYKKPKESK